MNKFKIILILATTLFFCRCINQKETNNHKPHIHKIDLSASLINLVEFNTKEDSNIPYVIEELDDSGRVSELRFYNSRDELTYVGSGFLGGPIIKYEYEKNKIIETFFESQTTLANDFCCSEVPYRHIYHLDGMHRILDIEFLYKMEFKWEKESLKEAEKNIVFYQDFESLDTGLDHVFGYTFSFAKMNGIHPTIK